MLLINVYIQQRMALILDPLQIWKTDFQWTMGRITCFSNVFFLVRFIKHMFDFDCICCVFWLLAEVIHHLTGNDWCVIMLKSSAMLSCFLIILSFVNIFSFLPPVLGESLMNITLTRPLRKQKLTMFEDKRLPAVLSIVSIINHIVGRVKCSS